MPLQRLLWGRAAFQKQRLVERVPLQPNAQVRLGIENGVLWVRREGKYRNPGLETFQLERHPLRDSMSRRLPGLRSSGGRQSRLEGLPVPL